MDPDTKHASRVVSRVAPCVFSRRAILALSGDCFATRYSRRHTALCAHGAAFSLYVSGASVAAARCAAGSVAAGMAANHHSSSGRADPSHSLAQAIGTLPDRPGTAMARDEHRLYRLARSRGLLAGAPIR